MKLISFLKKKIYNLNMRKFLKNYILMESNPDYADNTRFVFEELIKQNYNARYKIIWFVDNKEKYNDIKIKNVKFIEKNKKIKNLIVVIYYNLFAKYIIDCNKYIRKLNKYQFRIHLTHGTPLKLTPQYNQQSGEFDYLIQISDFFTDSLSRVFNVPKEKVITTGFPRNDILLKNEIDRIDLFTEISRKKVILWLPTYRKHKFDTGNEKITFKFGVPSIGTERQIIEINELLKKYDVLLLIKLHPAEDDSKIKELNLTNIKLINDEIFEKRHLTLYHLLNEVDALITDYSSVYYDFLITKKPIGLAIEDINEYKKEVELLFENFEENIKGEFIYNFEGLKAFIKNVSEENDITYNERIEKINLYNKYLDDKSSKRVVDLLKKNMKEEIEF